MTNVHLGIALQELGSRSGGDERRCLLTEAVAAFGAALEVYTREVYPRQWHFLVMALHRINHEMLFDFQGAYETGQMLADYDNSHWLDWVEVSVTAGHFNAAVNLLAVEQAKELMEAEGQLVVVGKGLKLLALAADNKISLAQTEQASLERYLSRQESEVETNWSWSGTRHFIETSQLAAIERNRESMLALVDLLDNGDLTAENLSKIHFQNGEGVHSL